MSGPKVTIRRVVRVAPCGSCGGEFPRDDMWAMNTKMFSPHDEQIRIPVRLCDECAKEQIEDLNDMRWDNSRMRTVYVEDGADG